MAQDKLNYDLDFQKNKLENALVPDVLVGEENPEDAINRGFVEGLVNYSTDFSKSLPTSIGVGGIPKDTPPSSVDGKNLKDIIDLMLYPLISPSYTLPNIEGSISNTSFITTDVGFKTDIVLDVAVNQNDALSIDSYTFSGLGITGTITQTSPTLILEDHILLEGDNVWTIGINYSGAVLKQNSHGVDDSTGLFSSGTILENVIINATYPLLYSVDYSLNDSTLSNGSDILDFMDCVRPYEDSFSLEVGSGNPVSVNIGVPHSDVDMVVIMNDIDVTNAFNSAKISDVKPWEEGVGKEYTVFNWYSNIELDEPTTLKFYIKRKYFSEIYDVVWDSSLGNLFINGESGIDSWDESSDNPHLGNDFSINREGDNIRIFSTIGNIRKVEKGRPFSLTEGLNSSDVNILDVNGRDNHLSKTNIYKFRLWIDSQGFGI